MDELKTKKEHGRDLSEQNQTPDSKRLYVKPHVTRFGAVTDYTQGGSLGTDESGNPFVYRN